jgi:hypothetical protein
MKSVFLGGVLGICMTISLAFNTDRDESSYSNAEVTKIEGFYIFMDSKPVMPYDSLGTVDLGFVSGTQYETIRANFIKRARKKYPNGDGIILHLNKSGLDKCSIIKFR